MASCINEYSIQVRKGSWLWGYSYRPRYACLQSTCLMIYGQRQGLLHDDRVRAIEIADCGTLRVKLHIKRGRERRIDVKIPTGEDILKIRTATDAPSLKFLAKLVQVYADLNKAHYLMRSMSAFLSDSELEIMNLKDSQNSTILEQMSRGKERRRTRRRRMGWTLGRLPKEGLATVETYSSHNVDDSSEASRTMRSIDDMCKWRRQRRAQLEGVDETSESLSVRSTWEAVTDNGNMTPLSSHARSDIEGEAYEDQCVSLSPIGSDLGMEQEYNEMVAQLSDGEQSVPNNAQASFHLNDSSQLAQQEDDTFESSREACLSLCDTQRQSPVAETLEMVGYSNSPGQNDSDESNCSEYFDPPARPIPPPPPIRPRAKAVAPKRLFSFFQPAGKLPLDEFSKSPSSDLHRTDSESDLRLRNGDECSSEQTTRRNVDSGIHWVRKSKRQLGEQLRRRKRRERRPTQVVRQT